VCARVCMWACVRVRAVGAGVRAAASTNASWPSPTSGVLARCARPRLLPMLRLHRCPHPPRNQRRTRACRSPARRRWSMGRWCSPRTTSSTAATAAPRLATQQVRAQGGWLGYLGYLSVIWFLGAPFCEAPSCEALRALSQLVWQNNDSSVDACAPAVHKHCCHWTHLWTGCHPRPQPGATRAAPSPLDTRVAFGGLAGAATHAPPLACPRAESNPLQQLDVVGNFVSDLGAVVRAHRQEAAKRASKADDGQEVGYGFRVRVRL